MRVPGYEDLSPIARGGFASVYRARQVAFDREVAVKVLTVEIGDGKDRRRFERECVLTGRLTGHPAIVTILDSGFTDHGQPYLTTPFYHAGSLAEHLRREGAFSADETLRIGIAVAGALELAHRNGILHRDVKPANVLLSAYGEPALTDFGIAALVQANGATATQLTQAFTVDHAPPEVLEGGRATVGADVYSLGSTLWMLLTGSAPFAGGDPGLLPSALRVRNDPLPPIGRPDVPDSLVAVLTKAMAKQPEDRYDTAAAFGEDLQAVQRELGQPVTPLRADAPLRTPPPRPADDDPAATQALSLAALEAFADAPPTDSSLGASSFEPVWAVTPPAAPVAAAVRPAPPGPPPAAPGEPRPRWRGAESGWYGPNPGTGADGSGPEPAVALGAPLAAAVAAAPVEGSAPVRPEQPAAHPHNRYGSGAGDDIAILPTPAPSPGDGHEPWQRLPGRRRALLLAALAAVVVIALIAWLLLRPGPGDTTITTPNPGETTTAPPTTAPPTTAAPPTTTAPTTARPVATTSAPTTAAPTTRPAPTTAAPASPTTDAATAPGSAVVPGGASPEVRAAADVAQRAGDALANADWATVRSLIPSLAGSDDGTLDAGWGRLDGVTMVVTDTKERRGQVALRVGEVAHERNTDDSKRTSLYCATWTVADGRVVGMADQQSITPSPWRDGWADPADAVDQLRQQCRKI